VRVLSKCVATVDTRATPSGGCQVDLSSAMWDFIAKSNKGGDPIVVTVRATTDGTCASTSKNESKMSVSEQDIEGGVYYWKSTVSASGTGGDIWRKSFGDTLAEEKISPSNATCFGCHFLSREGLRMTVSTDDNDSDDEYADVRSGDVDVVKKAFIAGGGIFGGANQQPGFQAFNHDHTLYLGSNGNGQQQNVGGTNTTAFFFLFNGDTAAAATPATVLAGNPGERPTMQDWSANDKSVVFVKPTKAGWANRKDDAHVFGGSIWTMDYTGGTFGAPVEIIHSNGDNNYYPSYSPDTNFIIYNHVPLQGTAATIDACANKMCPNDSFSNPKARISILPVGATASIDCERANGSPAAAPVDVSNSWPRWSPFIQTYKGAKLLWVTFSSTRDYGLRVRNHVKVGGVDQVQCYPPDSPMDPGGSHGLPFPGNCQQPQLWMAAINLSAAEVSNPGDPSFPAFWLPFQDINTHNHTAQWTQTVVTTPPPDGGTCIMGGEDCTKAPTACCGGLLCTGNGTCGIP
jgi:hypothetical protein